ncbi:hypothetical protein EW146_g600 [Bondarzewia mesenterica]|uniref:Uncharacterized protein n=1 Tax=Bondarzewia mesenterica TaxID=1095465 RepID=A0A4S4MCS1_9AGAM|nr:hypothetical protein EW146_g600 [Bondarzewia mesenterica]
MSPYPRPSTRRRRSASLSGSPSASRRTADDHWHPSTKRAYPHHSYGDISQSSPPPALRADAWKSGKRPRRDSLTSPDSTDVDMDALPTRRYSSRHNPSSGLPSTSAAFNLFPRPTGSKRAPRTSPPPRTKRTSPSPTAPNAESVDLRALHSSFVQRMRAWESARAGGPPLLLPSTPSTSCYRHPRVSSYGRMPSPSDGALVDSDDDIEILAGEPFSDDVRWGMDITASPPRKRARSLGMDPDLDGTGRTSSYASDDDVRAPLAAYTPSLSRTVSSSSNSSLVSLPLPPSTRAPPAQSNTLSPFIFRHPRLVPASASREEKAIVALSLALANGAAGLTDYGAVREVQAGVGGLETEAEIGEMWH